MIEQISYIILATLFSVWNRMICGHENGVYYSKGLWKQTGGAQDHPDPAALEKLIVPGYKDLHSIETPMWYSHHYALLFILMALFRHMEDSLWLSILCSNLIIMGASSMGGYKYQCYINVGSGLPCEDKNEGNKSEFILGKIHFWWSRVVSGKRRKYAAYLGILAAATGILLGFQII